VAPRECRSQRLLPHDYCGVTVLQDSKGPLGTERNEEAKGRGNDRAGHRNQVGSEGLGCGVEVLASALGRRGHLLCKTVRGSNF